MHKSNSGFTLIELMVVIVVMTILAILMVYALGTYKQNDIVSGAQKDFLATLRSVQNQVANGAHGASIIYVTVTTNGYKVKYAGTTQSDVSLPLGVTTNVAVATDICFVNQYLPAYDNTVIGHACNNCTSGTGFLCRGGPATLTDTSLVVTFSKANYSKTVTIEGTGMKISRIYAQ